MAYYNARNYYTKALEFAAGKGYADLVYIPAPDFPNKPVLLIKLKYNADANVAIEQIHRQEYPRTLEKYKGNILLIAINYNRDVPNESSGIKHHSCVIERA